MTEEKANEFLYARDLSLTDLIAASLKNSYFLSKEHKYFFKNFMNDDILPQNTLV